MADGCVSYPSVFVVDSGTKLPPPLPPKPGQTRIRNRRNSLIQNTLFVLVCLALCGLIVEGFFIYKLHKTNSDSNSDEPKTEARKAHKDYGPDGEKPVTRKPRPPTILPPSKPLAHLTAGSKKPEKDGIMEWNENGDSIIHGLKYRDGKLFVLKEGYYYVYSKLSYSAERPSFIHMVQKSTPRYMGDSLPLLTYRRHNLNPPPKSAMSNSYLGGVFHLYKDDAVFVHVNNGSLVRLHTSADNFFGMFML